MLECIESFFEDNPVLKYFVAKIIQVVTYIIIKPLIDCCKTKLKDIIKCHKKNHLKK